MYEMKTSRITAWDYLWYALYAFAGLGIELLLLSVLEPVLFCGVQSDEYSVLQRILHWSLTMACWGVIGLVLLYFSKKKLGFDVLQNNGFSFRGLLGGIFWVAACIALNVWDWGTLKIIGEFQQKEPIVFIFQYLYYAFEIGLVFLIVAFGQGFGEKLVGRKTRFPLGGLVLCVTWGGIHILSQQSVYTGLGVMAFGILYGLIYVSFGRNAKYSYAAMLLAFII